MDEGDGRYGFVAPSDLLPVAQDMKGIDIIPVMFHEIGHSLGIDANDETKHNLGGYTLYKFTDDALNPNTFGAHLYDQLGRRVDKANLWIMTPKTYEQIMKSGSAEVINYSSRLVFLTTSRWLFKYKEQEIVRQNVVRKFSHYK